MGGTRGTAITQRVVVDCIVQSLPHFDNLKKFPHGLGYGQRQKIKKNKAGVKKTDFAWHWMGSEGRTLLLVLSYVFWNICGSDIPDSFKKHVLHFNRMIVNLQLQHSISLLEVHTDTTLQAMNAFHAAWQYEVCWLAEKIDGIVTGFSKFHVGCHEASFITEQGAASMTAQHCEAELGFSSKRAAKRTNMQVFSMALQQDRSRRLVTTVNQHAFILNEAGARGTHFKNPRGPQHAAGPEPVKKTKTDVHVIKSRIEGEKCVKLSSTEFHSLKNLAPFAAKKLALYVNFPDYLYNKEADVGDNPAHYTLPYGSTVTTTPSCRIAGTFIRAELVPSRISGNLRRPRPASFVQFFHEEDGGIDVDEYVGKVLSIFQVKLRTHNTPVIYLHVQWLENLNPFIDSGAGTDKRRYYDKLFPRDVQPFYKSNFDNIPRNVLVPLVFRDLNRWEGSNIMRASDVQRVVYVHHFPNLPLPANAALRRPQVKKGLLFMNTLVSLPKQLYMKRIMSDPYTIRIVEKNWAE